MYDRLCPGVIPVGTTSYARNMNGMKIEVVRSERRRKTVQARLSDGTLRVLIPAHLSPEQEAEVVERMIAKTTRRFATGKVDLQTRAGVLARRYGLPTPKTIEWSDRQMKRWGSCTPSNDHIRISTRLATVPGWVLDAVLVHELTHLVVADHGSEFKSLVGRYRLTERATGYLMALSDTNQMKG